MKAQLKNHAPALSKAEVEKLVAAGIKAALQAELNSGNYEFDLTIEDKDVAPLDCIAALSNRIHVLSKTVAELEKALAAKPATPARFDAVKEGGAK